MGRTAPLTSKSFILYIYSTNIGTEYFKRDIYSPFFFLSSKCSLFRNSNIFGSCIIHILYTGCAKIKKKIRRQMVKKLPVPTKRVTVIVIKAKLCAAFLHMLVVCNWWLSKIISIIFLILNTL